MSKYFSLTDEQLVEQSHLGNIEATDCLMIRYKPMVISLCGSFFIKGGDRNDLIQEGMIGLFKAVRDYSLDKQTSFKSFATLCIKSQIKDALKFFNRKKHKNLNSSISLDLPAMADIACSDNPESAIIENEERETLKDDIINSLSKYEIEVLNLFLERKSYRDIAEITGKSSKSIDNAIQRIKNKIRNRINNS